MIAIVWFWLSISHHLEYLSGEITQIDAQIIKAMAPYQEQYKLRQTLPGVDSDSAARLLIEIGGDISKLKSSKNFCAWSGVSLGNNESAGKKKSKTRKANLYLRQTLCEIAIAASRTNCQFNCFHKVLKIRRGYKKSTIAVAH